jgi:PAS domain-containing protein
VLLSGEPLFERARMGDEPAIVVGRATLYPSVAVVASIPLTAALADWRAERASIFGVALAFIAMFIAAGAGVHVHLRRLARARAQVAEGKALLDEALRSMSDGFLLSDRHERLVMWNERYLDIFPWERDVVRVGLPLVELAEVAARHAVPDGTPEARRAWVERRMAHHRRADGAYEQHLADGRTIQVVERAMPAGGVVSIYHDVTVKER